MRRYLSATDDDETTLAYIPGRACRLTRQCGIPVGWIGKALGDADPADYEEGLR